jgi:hypothetical protein
MTCPAEQQQGLIVQAARMPQAADTDGTGLDRRRAQSNGQLQGIGCN